MIINLSSALIAAVMNRVSSFVGDSSTEKRIPSALIAVESRGWPTRVDFESPALILSMYRLLMFSPFEVDERMKYSSLYESTTARPINTAP